MFSADSGWVVLPFGGVVLGGRFFSRFLAVVPTLAEAGLPKYGGT